MASTNKTTNYELSQYIGTDKPTYLGDYNGDMLKIDTAIKGNADNITTLGTSLTEVGATASQASSLATGASATATQANTTANTANDRSVANASAISALEDFLTFGTSTYITTGTIKSGSGTIASIDIYTNKSADGKLCKVYGAMRINATGSSAIEVELDTNFDVSEEFVVSPCGNYFADGLLRGGTNIKFLTNGKIRFIMNSPANGKTNTVYAIPFLIFLKNFGDEPL